MKEIKNQIINKEFNCPRLNVIKDIVSKVHFKSLRADDKQAKHGDKPETDKKAIPKISEDQFLKWKNKPLINLINNINDKTFKDNRTKSVLIVEFHGTIGLIKTSDKGFIELVYLNNILNFFKKLERYFFIVIVFERMDYNGFYKKVTDFADRFCEYITLFSVVNYQNQAKSQSQKFKLKGPGSHRNSKKDRRKFSKSNCTQMKNNEMFIDFKLIEDFFPANKKFIVMSPAQRNLGLFKNSACKMSLLFALYIFK